MTKEQKQIAEKIIHLLKRKKIILFRKMSYSV